MALKVISMVKVDGQWVDQDDISSEKLQEILIKVMTRAANNIGSKVQKST